MKTEKKQRKQKEMKKTMIETKKTDKEKIY